MTDLNRAAKERLAVENCVGPTVRQTLYNEKTTNKSSHMPSIIYIYKLTNCLIISQAEA